MMRNENGKVDKSVSEKIPQTPEEINEYIVKNKRLILALLRCYRGLTDYEDLIQEASIGFYKGIITYNPNKGIRLSTYAYTCAKNEVNMYLRRINTKTRGSGTTPLSLETGGGSEDFRQDVLLGQLANPKSDIDDEVYTKTVYQAAIKIVNNMLDPDSRIIVYRFMQQVPQSKTAKELHVSQGHVSKMQNKALDLIRKELVSRGIID